MTDDENALELLRETLGAEVVPDTGYALELVRTLEGGFGGKRLAAGVVAEYVAYLELIGEDRARDAVRTALRTQRYLPRIAELAELAGARDDHPAARKSEPWRDNDPRLDLCITCGRPTPCHCLAPTAGVPVTVDDPTDGRQWFAQMRRTVAGSSGPLAGKLGDAVKRLDDAIADVPELPPNEYDAEYAALELEPDELDDEEPF